MNMNRLKEAEAMHARLLEDVKEVNHKHKIDYDEKVKVRKVREKLTIRLSSEL